MARISMPRQPGSKQLTLVPPPSPEPVVEQEAAPEEAEAAADEPPVDTTIDVDESLAEAGPIDAEFNDEEALPTSDPDYQDGTAEAEALEVAGSDELAAMAASAAGEESEPAQEQTAEPAPKRRLSAKEKASEVVLALSTKVTDLVAFLEQSPDSEALRAELSSANDALGRALALLNEQADDLGIPITEKPKVPRQKRKKEELSVGDFVEIHPKYRPRFAFLKGEENGTFTVCSLNGQSAGVQADHKKDPFYIQRSMLRVKKET